MAKKIIAMMGTGPLGLWTAAALANDSNADTLQIKLANRSGKSPVWIPPALQKASEEGRVSWHAIDALNAGSVRDFAEGASVLTHSAIPQYHEWLAQLPVTQRNANDAAIAVGARLICADNLYTYAAPATGQITENSPEIPPAKKGQLRKDVHDMLRKDQLERGLVWSTIQSSQYFGPGSTGQSIFGDWFIDPLLRGKPPRFVGRIDVNHSWAYAPDFGRAMALMAMTDNMAWLNRSWILPHVTHLPAQDLARLFFRELERQGLLSNDMPRSIRAIPRIILRVLGIFNPVVQARDEMLYQFTQKFEASGAQLNAATGLEETPLEQAIADTVTYWKETKFKR